jgi:isoleucyl-tRNA synthetase
VATLRRGERLEVRAGERTIPLGLDDVQPRAEALPGYAVAEEHGYLVALATELTPELVEEGLARELVHRLQTMRKAAGFEVADRIAVAYEAGPKLAAVLTRHGAGIATEVLATSLQAGIDGVEGYREQFDLEGEPATFVLRRA